MDRPGGAVIRCSILLLTGAIALLWAHNGFAAEERSYSIQVGAFKEYARARKLVERFTEQGHLSFSRLEEVRSTGTWHMVYVGKYPTRAEARRQAGEWKEKGVVSEFLIRETTSAVETEKPAPEPALTIRDVEFKAEGDDKEIVLIRGSRSFSPSVFPLEEGQLRLVIDIADALPYQKGLTELPGRGNSIQKVRIFYHREIKTLRVVLDLSSSKSYKVQQLLLEKEHAFAVVVEQKRMEEPGGSSPPETQDGDSFRSEGLEIKPKDLREMLLKHRFYASCWDHNHDFCNPEGDFENLFVEEEGGTVSDRASRLVWQRGGSPQPMSWNDALAYVNRLNRESFAGHRDWRLPTTEELGTLIERSWQERGLFLSPRFEAAQTSCWSVDTIDADRAWAVSFHLGHFSHAPKSFDHYVRAVRSGN